MRERLGDGEFRRRLDARFRCEKADGGWPAPVAPAVEGGAPEPIRLHLPLGDIEPESALRLAEAIEESSAALRIGLEHDLVVYGDVASRLGAELRALVGGPAIVACPGTTWCSRGIADSRLAASRISAAIDGGDGLSICLNGCPNNCGHAAVADIGLVGRIKTIGGVRTECFRLLAGGDKGRGPALARQLHDALPADRAAGAVAWLVDQYRAGRAAPRETFPEFARRTHESLSRGIARLLASP